ncbi:bifunctional diguanylate cyclase/phosphodiesterase [Pseudoteredinibacter isoporae]|uniref:bifunctional diguanylate cyclase/phosphodiesterase n=1 Tax=Pseudoteredinibacter isoporae TaxID=570281 RepID=UPI00310820EB
MVSYSGAEGGIVYGASNGPGLEVVELPETTAAVSHQFLDLRLREASTLLVGAVVASIALLVSVLVLAFINLRTRGQWLSLAFILSALLGLELWLESYIRYRYEQDDRAHIARRLGMVRANLESILNNNLSLIKGMGIAIAANPDLSKREFNLYAKETLRTETLLLNFAAAPDYVVKYVYPEKGNEAVIGLEYMSTPGQREDVLRVKNMRRMLVAGPVNIVQGGWAFIGRAPVYYADSVTGREVFWGIISSPMIVDDVYQAAGVNDLANDQEIAIRKKGLNGEQRSVFFGDPQVFEQNPVVSEMLIGAEMWQLASISNKLPEGLASALNGLRLGFLLLLLAGAFFLHVRIRQGNERKNLISALRYRERMLAQVGRIASVGGFEYEIDKGFIYWSREVFKILGVPFSRGPLHDVEFLDLIEPTCRDKVREALRSLSDNASETSLELELLLDDGRHKWVAIQAYSEISDEGRVKIKGAIQNITERKKSELTILRQANYDTLTQLPNRSLFDNRLISAVASANRSGEKFALLFIDLDRFKSVNDSLGHAVGDQLLQTVAERLNRCTRETDTLSRRSGDEFTLIATQIKSAKCVEIVARKIIEELKLPICISGNQIYVTASIGITLFPDDANCAETLLKNADQAMYAAKELGRNRFRFYTTTMQNDADERLRMHMDLIDAIEHEQLKVFYQPILDLKSGDVCEVEALLRWQHPEQGYIPPDKFIPLAEDVGLISQLGEISMKTAIADILEVNDDFGLNIGLSLNKSYREFFGSVDDGEEPWLSTLLSSAKRPPITIEITESILMEDDQVYQILDKLRKGGIKIAIDDFGTGYSSLSYLRRFPVDWLKIDRSFVRDVEEDQEDLALVESILAMAHKLGLSVVAEGLETEEQLRLLQMRQCDMAQGFFLARPMPLAEFKHWLRERNAPIKIAGDR